MARDPRSAIGILDSVDPRYSRTRGAIARKVAIGMAQAGDVEAATRIQSKVSMLHENAIYLAFLRSLDAPPAPAETNWPMPVQLLKSSPHDARIVDEGFVNDVVAEMRSLPDNIGTNMNGIHIFRRDVVGLAAETVGTVNPVDDYVLRHETLHMLGLETLARRVLDASEVLPFPETAAEFMTDMSNRIDGFHNLGTKLRVIASFALHLNEDDAKTYVNLVSGLDEFDRSTIQLLIDVRRAPNQALEELRDWDPSKFATMMAAPTAVSYISNADPLGALRSVHAFHVELAAKMLDAIVETCPLDDWKGIVDAIIQWKRAAEFPARAVLHWRKMQSGIWCDVRHGVNRSHPLALLANWNM
ncbi:hypothetical protein [uncultured Ruegeria sp.]|uniref:hypothetical protein n=1 Tax=uncultured Ruegeria sp. TaxID=259304 RepID=UPI0026342190|nr:hypothetical protein [uncultured Ruegeria sp.]